MMYPRMLVLSIGRVNLSDNANNGLLLRNLFSDWPRGNLAQIYSGGSNGDGGFFSRYYLLGPNDRLFGGLFTRLKTDVSRAAADSVSMAGVPAEFRGRVRLKYRLLQALASSGLHELLFPIRPSRRLLSWAYRFRPDIVFAQGYNLTFALLPLIISRTMKIPIVYYPTDDWPKTIYRACPDPPLSLSRLPRSVVALVSERLVRKSGICIAFNRMMRDAYRIRYRKDFHVLMHGDARERFAISRTSQVVSGGMREIVGTGVFDQWRMPLVFDLEKACSILAARGISARASIYPVNYPPAFLQNQAPFDHLTFHPCPSHDDLIRVLQRADVLFLPERFDVTVPTIHLCVSSKAHLFMFSGRPIIVYSDARTGIARYARENGWALVVDHRDPMGLARAIEILLTDTDTCAGLVRQARITANANHDLETIQSTFRTLCASLLQKLQLPSGTRK